MQGGNLVKASDTGNPPLVVINQVSPIYVTFSVPEQSLPRLRQLMASGNPPAVQALPSRGASGAEKSVLSFIDNAVDTTPAPSSSRQYSATRTRTCGPASECLNPLQTFNP